MGAEAFTAMVPEVTAIAIRSAHPSQGRFSLFLSYMWFGPRHQTCGLGPPLSLAVQAVQGVSTPGATRDVFPSVVRASKEKESLGRIEIAFPFAFSCLSSLSSSSVLELSVLVMFLTSTYIHGVRSPQPPFLIKQ
jgi:hypothetical protein